MKAMRNLLIHEYFGVNVEIIWQTIKHDLPPLKHQLREIMQDKQLLEKRDTTRQF